MKYLSVIIGDLSTTQVLALEVSLLLVITCISIVRVNTIGWIGSFLMILKYVPLFVLPLVFFMFFDAASFSQAVIPDTADAPGIVSTIATTSLLTFWGFVGVECATAATCNVRNPEKTIPRALIIGTLCVALVYILNIISVIGVVGFDELVKTEAPYSLVMNKVFGSAGDAIISVLAVVVCLSTLNSWIFTSGQIAHCAYTDGLFPGIFGRLNKHGAPIAALAFSFCGSIPFLILERIEQDGFDKLISRMCSVFMCVYLVCCLAYVKLIKRWYSSTKARWHRYALSCFAAAFCLFALAQDIIPSMVILAVFVVIGIPMLLRSKKHIG
jgi:APA family basic amino acid/polyamine antiporter